jgi:hypothetical protein
MLRVSSTDPSDDLVGFVRSWFELLAENRFAEACGALDKPNSYGIRWTPDMIQSILEDNFGPETVFGKEHPEGVAVSSISATEGSARVDISAFTDGSGYSLEHDVPLNGVWSDLTAQFEFERYPRGFAVVLHDLHVM